VPQIIARNDGYQNNKYYGALVTVNADLGFAKLTVIRRGAAPISISSTIHPAS
jgi:hypothetical protein